MQNRCSKKVCKNKEKWSENGAKKGAKINENPLKNRSEKKNGAREYRPVKRNQSAVAGGNQIQQDRKQIRRKKPNDLANCWRRTADRWSADRRSADRRSAEGEVLTGEPRHTLTRLGRKRPGADLSCLRQVSAPGPGTMGCKGRRTFWRGCVRPSLNFCKWVAQKWTFYEKAVPKEGF